MSKQHNKVEKRRRRTAYLRRLKARHKQSSAKAAPSHSAASAN